ncbi:hypothetical protein [Parahaliea mediterranea]|uniref:hypothetical protein n=1 Tax=Parahaliea mediterranea TaxID=651086 RepID=UPI0013005204|nr:hypothetical protein [Parahaliea mediterranea]
MTEAMEVMESETTTATTGPCVLCSGKGTWSSSYGEGECPRCGGGGIVETAPPDGCIFCAACGGAGGYNPEVDPDADDDDEHSICPLCDGQGFFEDLSRHRPLADAKPANFEALKALVGEVNLLAIPRLDDFWLAAGDHLLDNALRDPILRGVEDRLNGSHIDDADEAWAAWLWHFDHLLSERALQQLGKALSLTLHGLPCDMSLPDFDEHLDPDDVHSPPGWQLGDWLVMRYDWAYGHPLTPKLMEFTSKALLRRVADANAVDADFWCAVVLRALKDSRFFRLPETSPDRQCFREANLIAELFEVLRAQVRSQSQSLL